MSATSRAARLAVAWRRRAAAASRAADADYGKAVRRGNEADIVAAGIVSDHMWQELQAARAAVLSATHAGIDAARAGNAVRVHAQ